MPPLYSDPMPHNMHVKIKKYLNGNATKLQVPSGDPSGKYIKY